IRSGAPFHPGDINLRESPERFRVSITNCCSICFSLESIAAPAFHPFKSYKSGGRGSHLHNFY
ncbi:MAG TPA: hypothetical protein VFC89_06740, partial [Oscillospiraceae bacterium]|nr:hypothetical protein [Oscillospiraceae bacterium]